MKYMPKRYDEVFDDMFDSFFPRSMNMDIMKTDIHEKDGYYNLEVELPGYQKQDVEMEISQGYLTIKAKHSFSDEEKDKKGNLIRSERSFGSCQRSFFVGEEIKAEDVKAKFNNGVLEINLPSKEQKRIETKQSISID